jgi:hypothetical protein
VAPSLLIAEGSRAGERIEITSELVLGREGADVIIEDDELSRRHARLRPADGAVEVEDLDSLNGTWVNGMRISEPTRLAPGDVLRLGMTTLELFDEPQPLGETIAAPMVTVLEGTRMPVTTADEPSAPLAGVAARITDPDAREREELDRLTLRVAGAAAVVGTILGIPAQLLHPLPEADVPESFLEEVTAASSYWTAVHLIAVTSFTLGFVSLFGVYRYVAGAVAKLFATLAVVFGAIGTAFVYSWFAVDGAAIVNVAEDWERAPPAQLDVAFRVANGIEHVILAYFSLVWVFWFGIPFVLAGAAIFATTRGRIPWLALWGMIAGSAAIVAGVIQVYTGRDFVVTDIVIPITGFVVGGWVLVMGVFSWRRASELARAGPA